MTKTNKIHAAIYTVLSIALIVFIAMWYKSQKAAKRLSASLDNSYDRAFFELTDYVNDIDALLSKAQLASSPAQLASISNEIFMQAAEAKSCFGELPQQNANFENTARFLSQVGDYTYVLSQNMIKGNEITSEEYDNLNSLNEYASKLGGELSELQQRVYNGELSFVTASANLGITANAENDIFADLSNVEKSFEGYPSLIYDGPFSEHIENMEPIMLKDAKETDKQTAMKKAEEFLGETGLKYESEMINTAIEAYNFSKEENGVRTNISITKKGGYVLYFLKNRSVEQYNFDAIAATECAYKYLESKGFNNMKDSYYEIADNIATINFAYSQDGTKCYSDLIKVRVALDDGSVIGIECKGYLMNHHVRDVSDVFMTADEAKTHVSSHLEVVATSLAVIPKDSLREVLCYEFKGTYMDKNFIVYVNAQNGQEEEIMLLIESENGILTI